MIAQKYYARYLLNIKFINDESYDAYNFTTPYDIENVDVRLGEACEAAIIGVLWDLYDSNNEENDKIALGYSEFWNATTTGKSKTFSEFVNHFYNMYPQYKYYLGENLVYYNMTSTPYCYSKGTQTTPPMFVWRIGKASEKFPNNGFALVFFDGNGNEILRTSEIRIQAKEETEVFYSITQEQWKKILNSNGQTYKVSIVSYQTDEPRTGGYISSMNEMTKPIPESLTLTDTMSASTKYYEKKIDLQPGQYADVYITFSASGSKIIQTFGMTDTIIELYNSSGTLLKRSDDEGYGNNAFIRYEVTENTQYIIRVKFYSSSVTGTTKLAITPTSWLINSGSTSIESYNDIWAVTGKTSYTLNTSIALGNTKVVTFTAPSAGSYTFKTIGSIDTYMYIIDPRSSALLTISDYNDNGGEGLNAQITKTLEVGVPYLIIYSAYNIQNTSATGSIRLNITKN